MFYGVNFQDTIFNIIVDFQNIAEWCKIVLLYQLYSVMLLFILKRYHLFNKFEIMVAIATPKFHKDPHLIKVLQEMLEGHARSWKSFITSLEVSYKMFYGTRNFLARSQIRFSQDLVTFLKHIYNRLSSLRS